MAKKKPNPSPQSSPPTPPHIKALEAYFDNIDEAQKVHTRSKITDMQCAEALQAARGLQYVAARMLGITPAALSARILNTPALKALRDDLLELRIDMAEISLAEMVELRNLGSICFFLNTRAKHRGYGQGDPMTNRNEAHVVKMIDNWEKRHAENKVIEVAGDGERVLNEGEYDHDDSGGEFD